MRIGIIEICGPNHYTAVVALAETYAVDANNEIVIFTLPEIAPLFSFDKKNISLQIKQDSQTIAGFLAQSTKAGLDRILINTISGYYREFANVEWNTSVWFTVHNVDFFFANKHLQRLRLLLFEWSLAVKAKAFSALKDAFAQYIKDFGRQKLRARFIENLMRTNYKVIVYSNSQKRYLEQYVEAGKIVVFPFCVNEAMEDNSLANLKMRICVPGTVSNRRRDYTSLLSMIKKHLHFFKEHITLDILGYIPTDERQFIGKFNEVKQLGVDVIYSIDFIDTKEYDSRLSKADLILGNLKVQVDPHRRYGDTKETGVIFNVIKAGKPALLPAEYPVDDVLQEICLFFNDYEDLYQQITTLANNNAHINGLKHKAKNIVKYYTPQNLYHLLAK